MSDLFGVRLVTATIARISQDCAHRLTGFADTVRDHVATAPVKPMDETGFRIGGKTQWLHIASTIWLTFYRVSARRCSLLATVTGTVVHDHWKPYYTMTYPFAVTKLGDTAEARALLTFMSGPEATAIVPRRDFKIE